MKTNSKTLKKGKKSVKIGSETFRIDAEAGELISLAMKATGISNRSHLLLEAVKAGLPTVVLKAQEELERRRQEQASFWRSKKKGSV